MQRRWVMLLLSGVTALAFWSVIGCEFLNYDDDVFVTDNPQVWSGLTAEGWRWAWTTTLMGVWQPLAWLMLMLQVEIFGVSATGVHMVSLLFHLGNVCLLFLLLDRLTGARWRSAVVALLFAVHPLRVESVAWVAEQRDLQYALLALLTMHAYVSWARHGLTRHAVLACAFFAGALLTKPQAVVIPPLLLLLDYWPLGRRNWGRLILEKTPLVAASLALSLATMRSHAGYGITPVWRSERPLEQLADVAVNYARYMVKMVDVRHLAVFYPRQAWPGWMVAGCTLLLLCATVLVLREVRRRPWLGVGWAWFVVALLPVVGLVKFGAHSFADRYTYLSGIGLLVMVVWSLPEFAVLGERARKLAVLSGAALAAVMVWLTTAQIGHWKNSETVFRHALGVTRDNYLAHNNLGAALSAKGDMAAAAEQFRAALALRPTYPDAHLNLAAVLEKAGRTGEAEQAYRNAIGAAPGLFEARLALGMMLLRERRAQEGLGVYEEALKVRPDDPDALYGMGLAMGELDRWPEARDYLMKVVAINPNHSRSRFNLGNALQNLGDREGAIREYSQALRLDPTYERARESLRRLSSANRVTSDMLPIDAPSRPNP